jgi:hypothetical protein
MVQDPNEAEYPDMTQSEIHFMGVDYFLPLSKMGKAISSITQTETDEMVAPPDVITESEIA